MSNGVVHMIDAVMLPSVPDVSQFGPGKAGVNPDFAATTDNTTVEETIQPAVDSELMTTEAAEARANGQYTLEAVLGTVAEIAKRSYPVTFLQSPVTVS